MAFRRNLLIVLTHGLRSDAVGDHGAWPDVTPRFDEIARRGLRLVATSASPQDDGGMISLLTALHARQHGHVHQTPPSVQCRGWPAMLRNAGYHVAGVGCVNMLRDVLDEKLIVMPVRVGDDQNCEYLNAAEANGHKHAVVEQRKQQQRYGPFDPDRLLLEPEDDIDGFIGLQACEMLRHMPDEKPWALIVIFSGPGNDLPPPSGYDRVVEPTDLQNDFVPADFRAIDVLAELDYPRIMLQRLESLGIGRIRADYLGRVALIDAQVGDMMSTLGNRDDGDRTWFALSADHGYLLGEHGLVGHRSFLAPSVEVPAVITPPTPAKHDTPDWLCSTVDIGATIAHLGGADVHTAIAGRNLLPLLAGEDIGPSMSGHLTGCLSEFNQRLMLETERYKIIFDTDSHDILGIFDLLNDSDERTNLVRKAAARNLADALRWRVGDALIPLRAMPAGS